MSRGNTLFSTTAWFDVREARKKATFEEINSLDADRILNTSVDTLCKYYEDKNAIEVPSLDRAQVVIDHREVPRAVNDYGRRITVTATEIEVNVPFSGPSDAFRIQPSMYSLNLPQTQVASGVLIFSVDACNRDQQQVRQEIERSLDLIEQQLGNLRANIAEFQKELPPLVRDWIERRRAKLLADQNLVSSLGYKLKARQGVPLTYAPPEVRRKIAPQLPPKSTTPFKPEPALTNEDYEHILSVLRDMAVVMERSPSAFRTLDEEALRFQFLVPLNGHYEGAASGETFNYSGKTDILIRADGRNIFVAECKFWAGPKQLAETIDQLLGYTCWRDTKTAIILFNRNKNFTKVLEAIPATVAAHPNHVRPVGKSGETAFRFVFSHRDDPNRELTLTVLAFDVPQA
jgi:hypothetical protein